MKNILWIGSYITEESIDTLNKMGFNKASTYVSQKNLVDGIEKNTGTLINSIGAAVLPDYPKCKTLFFKRMKMPRSGKAENVLVGYLNLKYVNKFSTNVSLVREAVKFAKRYRGEGLDIFVYEMRSGCMMAAVEIKKRVPNTKIHLIVPDLPMFTDLNMSRFKVLLKKADQKRMIKLIPEIDSFILYAADMAKYLGIENRKTIVMEGSVNSDEILKNSVDTADPENERFTVMYSGNVDKKFGIFELIEAYKYLDDGYALRITGGGADSEAVKNMVAGDPRITYYGYIPKRQDLLSLQKSADAFVNIRRPDEEASAYCFPSKLFEFMLSGKPVLSCRLGGIPDEYFDYLIEIKSMNPRDIADAIRKTAEMTLTERKSLGERGRNFVAEKKNNIIQTKRILDFIKE